MSHGSTQAVITAIVANGAVTVIKFIAATIAGSASMMNEAVHSLMDTLNQAFLFLGLQAAERPADEHYAFGHGQKKYLWNLWSAIGLFSIGSGLGLAHAWHSWHQLEHLEPVTNVTLWGLSLPPLWVNLLVLATAFLLEGYSFLVAGGEFLRRMHREGYHNPFRYLLQSSDPTLVAVVLEDSVAMIGLLLAALGIGLAQATGNPLWDIGFSAIIAAMLGLVAFYLGRINMRFLTDLRDGEAETAFVETVEGHGQVERYHDLRSIIIDEHHTVLVAEVELREEAIVPDLDRLIDQERQALLECVDNTTHNNPQMLEYCTVRATVQATLKRTEQIIDELEDELKRRIPRVSHITLEVQGIAADPGALGRQSPPS